LGNDNFVASFEPSERNNQLFSAFLQDEIALVRDKLKLTLGSKLEHNDYTGFEVQPSGRIAWLPTDRQTVWAAASRAVHTPSRAANDIRLNLEQQPGAPSTAVVLTGNSSFDSEELWAYELGYRLRPVDRVSLDVTGFVHDYDRLRQFEFGTPFLETEPAPHVVAPLSYENDMHGQTYGVEFAATYQATDGWRLQAAYSYLESKLHLRPNTTDPFAEDYGHGYPSHQVWLRSSLDLPHGIQFDLMGRFMDNLPSRDIPSYFSLNARLAWRPCPHVELSIVGQDLLDPQHPESSPDAITIPQTEVQRSIYGQLTIRY
jgi:iron complex outermembrane receptor protein